MLVGRKKRTTSSFGPDGRRRIPMSCKSSLSCSTTTTTTTTTTTSSRLFTSQPKIFVQRAPLFQGLNVRKNFRRPMTKRRAYNKHADSALASSSLGMRRRMDGMSKLMARAGRGLTYKLPTMVNARDDGDASSSEEEEEDNDNPSEDRPFEPLQVWTSPHQGGQPKGLPPTMVTEMQPDEYGVEEQVTLMKPAPLSAYSTQNVCVPPVLAKWLRPHQREGVQFLYECVMGLKDYPGQGCILADDMGLGKTLQSVALIYTLLQTRLTSSPKSTAQRVIVVCPCSLVKNWEHEFVKWLGPGKVKCLALAEADRQTVEKNIDIFVRTSMFQVLVASYECIRAHISRFTKHKDCCDLLVCDEAHRLKNRDNQTSQALFSLPVQRRVLLTGTPMQNDLQEFYAMVDFTNPGVLGTPEEFRKHMLFPILRGREPDATPSQKQKMITVQEKMSTIVNEFILRRINTLNAQHLPPKLVQVVCCNLTDIQQQMYQHLVNSKDMHHVLNGKQVNCLGSIQMLMKLCNHPTLIVEQDSTTAAQGGGRRSTGRAAASKKIRYTDHYDDHEPSSSSSSGAAPGADGVSKFLPYDAAAAAGGSSSFGRRSSSGGPVHPEWSGKMFVLYRLMKEMRRPGNGNDKIVIVSNYTQTLDLIGKMCGQHNWGFCRLDGSISMKKRQKMVDDFNNPTSSLIAFLLSSKAGGCGLNLIGGNRLVLFDPDWNPAVDKQAAARCWRDGQKKRCFTYRFLATGTVEEKIFQRQLSKEGLQSVVDDKEQVNSLSTKDLRNLFKFRGGTPSDTHDKLKCERCRIIADNAEWEAQKLLPRKLRACSQVISQMRELEDARPFLQPLDPTLYGVSREEYEKLVKQPIDLGTIAKRLETILGTPPQEDGDDDEENATATATTTNNNNNSNKPTKIGTTTTTTTTTTSGGYKNVSELSKDVNRIFSNVVKVWTPSENIIHNSSNDDDDGDTTTTTTNIADTARRLQSWWIDQWTALVPKLMTMKMEDLSSSDSEVDMDKDDNHKENKDNMECVAHIGNERGDDFQEQIGMPDEENMRHWSHHHDTDTVDDPVFRAAMRGSDAVSFVFGLEVTWSLIQQRQQEEEERQAMLELEELEKHQKAAEQVVEDDNHTATNTSKESSDGNRMNDDKENGTDNVGNDETSSSPELVETEVSSSTNDSGNDGNDHVDDDDDEEWSLSRIFTLAEIQEASTQSSSSEHQTCASESCMALSCSIWKSSKGETYKCCVDCQDEEFGGWPASLEPTDPDHLAAIRSHCSSVSGKAAQVEKRIDTKSPPMLDDDDDASTEQLDCDTISLDDDGDGDDADSTTKMTTKQNMDCSSTSDTDTDTDIATDDSPSSSSSSPESDNDTNHANHALVLESNTEKEANKSKTPKNKKWACYVCTFENIKSARKCKMCHTKRPSSQTGTKRSADEIN